MNTALVGFNRGIVSKLALARVDLERMRFSAEVQTNWMPRTLGPMSLRTGLWYIGDTKNNSFAEFIPFVRSAGETASIELTPNVMRVRTPYDLVTRASVATVVTNGEFQAPTGWTLSTSGGAQATISGGLLSLSAPAKGGVASATNAVAVAGGDQATEHALRVAVVRGPIEFRVGTTSGGDNLVPRTRLLPGTHSIAFTPNAGTFYIYFESTERIQAFVDYVVVEAAGVMEIPTTWGLADLEKVRFSQSADVIFVACAGQRQCRIERRGVRSWSVTQYRSGDGPFRASSSYSNLDLTPSGTTGNITLSASRSFFQQGHIGSLIRLFQTSQRIDNSLGSANTFTSAVRVSGSQANGDRTFTIDISGTWAGTLTLQRSFDSESAGFSDVAGQTFTANTAIPYADTFDNQVVWYRVGFKTGNYTSGSANISLSYPRGGGAGIVRITDVTSGTLAAAEVLSDLKSVQPTSDWREGEWSQIYGWPSAVSIYDGRLWWFGRDKEWGSVSDAYDSFDADVAGEAGPISRSIGYGPIETINWALPLQRLILGTASSEISVRSSSFDEPLTPTNFSQKDCSTQGSAGVAAAKMDGAGIFIQRSGQRLIRLAYSLDKNDYAPADLTQLVPDMLGSGIFKRVAIQRQPDTRIHCVASDGKAYVLIYEPDEQVVCWVALETSGTIENVFVLPEAMEDRVYYLVNRGASRYVEALAFENVCKGFPEARLSDSHVMFSAGAPTTTITGLSRFNGQQVVVWGWNTATPFTNDDGTIVGRDFGTFTVSGGQIVVPDAITNACVGLFYRARFKSAKLAYAGGMGTALGQRKRLPYLGVLMMNTHYQGLRYGRSFDELNDLPLEEAATGTPAHTVWQEYDEPAFSFPGEWDTDSRLCLEAAAPRPCTLQAAIITVETHDKG